METLRQLRRLGAAAHLARCIQRSYTSEEAYVRMERAEAMSGTLRVQGGACYPVGQASDN
jgi:hypothetical protein